jgi:hypothetical protein
MLLFITQIRPENKNGPSARSRTVRSARQATIRPEKKRLVGLLAHSALHALSLVVGLDQESCVPPGPRLGPLSMSRPSASNGHAWILAEQNAVGALA